LPDGSVANVGVLATGEDCECIVLEDVEVGTCTEDGIEDVDCTEDACRGDAAEVKPDLAVSRPLSAPLVVASDGEVSVFLQRRIPACVMGRFKAASNEECLW
jgi:hypothetical protein